MQLARHRRSKSEPSPSGRSTASSARTSTGTISRRELDSIPRRMRPEPCWMHFAVGAKWCRFTKWKPSSGLTDSITATTHGLSAVGSFWRTAFTIQSRPSPRIRCNSPKPSMLRVQLRGSSIPAVRRQGRPRYPRPRFRPQLHFRRHRARRPCARITSPTACTIVSVSARRPLCRPRLPRPSPRSIQRARRHQHRPRLVSVPLPASRCGRQSTFGPEAVLVMRTTKSDCPVRLYARPLFFPLSSRQLERKVLT